MEKKLLVFLLLLFTFLIPSAALAQEEWISASSANIRSDITTLDTESASRVKILKGYLEKYNSPLAPFAQDFVDYANKYDLDWRLVAAIAGVESTYGKAIPYNSNNAWGWGVYGDNVIRFATWRDGIATVSQGLRKNYMDKWGGDTIHEIGRIYAASPHWANSVNIHLNMINKYSLNDTSNMLSLAF